MRYLRRFWAILRVAPVPPTIFLIFSVSLHEVVLYGCSIATITRKFIFADFLKLKVGYFSKISPFRRFLTIFYFLGKKRYEKKYIVLADENRLLQAQLGERSGAGVVPSSDGNFPLFKNSPQHHSSDVPNEHFYGSFYCQ